MKKVPKKPKGIVKGAPSGLVISLLVHAAVFMLAGLLVVFTVHQKEEKKFVPPKPVDRPKMKLKKPKVKVKKSAKPKSTSRIVTTVKRAGMPDIELPGMSGMVDGLAGGIGGFEIIPDLGNVTMFGSKTSIGNDLEGTFYDFKRDRSGRTIPVDMEGNEWRRIINKFMKNGWKTSTFARYYRAPQKLYATTVVVPVTKSGIAPVAFGDKEAVGALWAVHYTGQLVHKEGIKFRFWGIGDEFLMVRVDGEIVLGAWWPGAEFRGQGLGSLWESSSIQSERYQWGNNMAVIGDWIELEPGEAKDIDILIGDNGGIACFILGIEEEGVEYERSGQPSPILPAFKTAQPTHDLLDAIYKELPVGDVCLTNGPVFNDYFTASAKAASSELPEPIVDAAASVDEPAPEPTARAWTLADGRSFEAELPNIIGDVAVFKTRRGKIQKIPMADLSPADRKYLELSFPPDLKLDFMRDLRQVMFTEGFYGYEFWERPSETLARFGVRIKQTSTGDYSHQLHAEIFAVGYQRTTPDKHYLLLDRQETSFTLTKENQRTHEFRSEHERVLTNFEVLGQPRGEKYVGYLVVVRDSRGEIIAMNASNDWLVEHRENIEKLAVGNYFDKTGRRVYPGRPRPLWK